MTHDQGVTNPLNRPSFTLREAADRCGVSLSTMRRRHASGAFPLTFKDPDGAWRVTIEDLLGAGLSPAAPTGVSDPDYAHDEPRGTFMSVAVDQWVSMADRLSRAEAETALLRAVLEERGRALDDLRALAFRELEPGPVGRAAVAGGETDELADTRPTRRRRWRRDRAAG